MIAQNNNIDAWKMSLISLLSVSVVYVIMFWDTLSSIVSIWMGSDTFTHGFFIIPISAYLIWKKRDILKQLTPSKTSWLLLPALGLSFLWTLAYVAEVQLIKQMAAVCLLISIIWFFLGNNIAKTIAFPLGFILFSVPFGEFLVAPLQDLTAVFTVEAVRLSGIPVYWEGRFFNISSGRFEVAEACSGVRFLIVSIVLASLYAYLSYTSLWRRLLFIGVLALVSILANGLRAYGIVMMAHYSDHTIGVGADHLYYGWIFFGLTLFVVFWMGSFFQQNIQNEINLSVKPSDRQSKTNGQRLSFDLVKIVMLVSFTISSGPLFAKWIDSAEFERQHMNVNYPFMSNIWQGPYKEKFDWMPLYNGASVQGQQKYIKQNGDSVIVYVAKYFKQQQGAELINSENSLYDKSKWREIYQGVVDVKIHNQTKQYIETVITTRGKNYLLWHWYQVGTQTSIKPLETKLLEIAAKLTKSAKGSKIIIMASSFKENKAEASKNILELLAMERLENVL